MAGKHITGQKGFTLAELLVALAVLALLLTRGIPAWKDLAARERVVAATNRLHGLLRFSRHSAMEGGPVVAVCNQQCPGFDEPLQVTAFRDSNDNLRLDEGEEVLRRIRLDGLSSLRWGHFNGPDGLRYLNTGLLYYQNGSYLLCADGHGRKIVMNWIGRTRVEKADGEACPPG